ALEYSQATDNASERRARHSGSSNSLSTYARRNGGQNTLSASECLQRAAEEVEQRWEKRSGDNTDPIGTAFPLPARRGPGSSPPQSVHQPGAYTYCRAARIRVLAITAIASPARPEACPQFRPGKVSRRAPPQIVLFSAPQPL